MTHTLRGAAKGVKEEWQTDKQSRAAVRVEARPPTGQGHIVGARGFATHSGSVTICQITKIENNFHAQQRERQAGRKRGGEEESGRERSLSWDQIFVLVLLPLSSSAAPALHNFISHSSTWAWESCCCASSPAPAHIFTSYPLPPPLAVLCLYSMRPDKQTFPCLRLQSACLSGWGKQGHNECQDEPGQAAIEGASVKAKKISIQALATIYVCNTRLLPLCPARTDSLAAALLQFPSGSTTSTTSVTVLPTQGLPHSRTYASGLSLCVCVRFALWKFNRNYKQQDKWLLVAISLNEAVDRRKDQGLVPVFL